MFDINKIINSDELHQLVFDTFKEGTVPADKNEFIVLISNKDTTDGSYCFSNIFGDDNKDETVMFFLHPTCCKIPPRYRHNMKNHEFFAMELINLDYQLMLAKISDNSSYLQLILDDAKEVHDLNPIVSKFRNVKPADYDYAFAEMILRNENENETKNKRKCKSLY